MTRTHAMLALATLAALGLAAPAARAQIFTFDTSQSPLQPDAAGFDAANPTTPETNQGYYYAYGFHDQTNQVFSVADTPNGNTNTDTNQIHGFTIFQLGTLNTTGKTVVSATLTLNSVVFTTSAPTATLDLWSVPTSGAATLDSTQTDPFVFHELGGEGGVLFGTATVPTQPGIAQNLTFSLDAAALSYIASAAGQGYFSIGASLDPAATAGGPDISLASTFSNIDYNGTTYGIAPAETLTVTLAPTPEPSQFATLGLGALSLGGLALRAKRRHAC